MIYLFVSELMGSTVSLHPVEAAVVALIAIPILAVGDVGPVGFSPLYAGVIGAILASMRQGHQGLQEATESAKKGLIAATKWIVTLLSGASATAFGSPALCVNLGIGDNHTQTVIYFGLGLIGSQVIDLIILHGRTIATRVLIKFGVTAEEVK